MKCRSVPSLGINRSERSRCTLRYLRQGPVIGWTLHATRASAAAKPGRRCKDSEWGIRNAFTSTPTTSSSDGWRRAHKILEQKTQQPRCDKAATSSVLTGLCTLLTRNRPSLQSSTSTSRSPWRLENVNMALLCKSSTSCTVMARRPAPELSAEIAQHPLHSRPCPRAVCLVG